MIEFVDLRRQYQAIKAEVDEAVQSTMAAGAFIGGSAVESFEREFASFSGAEHAISVASGTDALFLTLKAIGVGPGDEIITVSNTFIATVSAIAQTGATVVFADVNPDSYCMDPASLPARVTTRTKAIIPVHLYGHPAAMDPIMDVAQRHGLFVLEDACQAHGARYKGRRAGSLGHAAAFSFYPGKNLGAYGDGGAVTTSDGKLAESLRRLRDHGRISKYEHSSFAFNSRLDAMQAAVLAVKLRYLEQWNRRRREIAARYTEMLSGLPGIVPPREAAGVESVYHLYVVRTPFRSVLQHALTDAQVSHGIHYPIPVHLQPAWRAQFPETGGPGTFPIVERHAGQILSLPLHPEMTDREVEYVAGVVRQALTPERTVSASPRLRVPQLEVEPTPVLPATIPVAPVPAMAQG